MNRIYLKVPYVEKDAAKSLGASWDMTKRQWFITEDFDIKLFSRWHDSTLVVENVVPTKQAIVGTSNTGELRFEDNEGISLTQYLKPIQHAVQSTWSQPQWVHAEIENIKKVANGHYYLDLIDYSESDSNLQKTRARAKVKAIIWATQAENILNKFALQTGQTLSINHKVMLKLRADMHMLYGVSVAVEDIDPAYTLGAMALKLKKIRKQLKLEGVYTRQSSFSLPNDFFRIAVISPQKAQALGDFRRIADDLHALCHFEYFTATFQGAACTESLLSALKRVEKKHAKQAFDAMIIIRGGGAKGDLHYLNEYDLANRICTFPVPVLSGIGHDSDQTIIDEVAHIRFSTPTKTAMFIRNQILESGQKAIVFWSQIEQKCYSVLENRAQNINTLLQRVMSDCRQCLNNNKYKLNSSNNHLLLIRNTMINAIERLAQQKNNLSHLSQVLSMRNKERLHNSYADFSVNAVNTLRRKKDNLISIKYLLITMQNHLNNHKRVLFHIYNPLITQIPKNCLRKRRELEQTVKIVKQSHPQRILQKGFAIVRQQNKVITRAVDLKDEHAVEIEFYDDKKRH